MILTSFLACVGGLRERERVRSVSKQFHVEASITIPDLSLDVGEQQRVHGRYLIQNLALKETELAV